MKTEKEIKELLAYYENYNTKNLHSYDLYRIVGIVEALSWVLKENDTDI